LQALDLLGQLGLLGLFFSQYFMDVSQADDPPIPTLGWDAKCVNRQVFLGVTRVIRRFSEAVRENGASKPAYATPTVQPLIMDVFLNQ
jgi:hypothetical protein